MLFIQKSFHFDEMILLGGKKLLRSVGIPPIQVHRCWQSQAGDSKGHFEASQIRSSSVDEQSWVVAQRSVVSVKRNHLLPWILFENLQPCFFQLQWILFFCGLVLVAEQRSRVRIPLDLQKSLFHLFFSFLYKSVCNIATVLWLWTTFPIKSYKSQ